MEWKGPLRYNRLFPVPCSTLYIANSFNAWMPPKKLILTLSLFWEAFYVFFTLQTHQLMTAMCTQFFISIPLLHIISTNEFSTFTLLLSCITIERIQCQSYKQLLTVRILPPKEDRNSHQKEENEWSRVEYVVIFSLLTHNFLFEQLASGHNQQKILLPRDTHSGVYFFQTLSQLPIWWIENW